MCNWAEQPIQAYLAEFENICKNKVFKQNKFFVTFMWPWFTTIYNENILTAIFCEIDIIPANTKTASFPTTKQDKHKQEY